MSKRGASLQNKGQRGARRAAAEREARVHNGPRGPGKPPSRFGGWLRRALVWGAGIGGVGLVSLLIAVVLAANSLPGYSELQAIQTAQTIVVRARDGTEIVEIGPSYGEWLRFEEIPDSMKNAMVAVEDKRFYSHFGIDFYRTAAAVIQSFTKGERIGATSSITQQLARNIFLNSNRNLDRKAREALLALALEWKFSKEQILELYLNKVYFGGGAYGIDSASRKFFSHPATELSIGEAAIIAGLVKAPSRYSPTADVQAAVDRATVVLRLMQEQGYISADQAQVDISAVQLKQQSGQNSVRYFTDWVLPQLDLFLPETAEPIEVWTTLDIGMQRAATAAIESNTPGAAQGALVSMDRDGAVLALVGGRDYVASNYNRATSAQRQPGSAWKLFVYLAALEAGYVPEDTVVDEPVTINGWSPRNANGRNVGETTLRAAFAFSINTVAAQLGNEVGFGTVAAMARRFGITSQVNTLPSMVLGTSEVRLIDMTRAFAAVSAKGRSVEPYGISKVTTTSGELLYRHATPTQSQLVPDYVIAGITDLLQAAVQTGTGSAAQIGRPVAGKTGTTSSNKDGWFVGFSSGITTGVWMGRDDAKAVPGLQGGRAPAQAFAAYMRYAVKDRPVEEFDVTLNLPDWLAEPDEEALFGDPDEYYYIDENGNLVEPGRRQPGQGPLLPDGERTPLPIPPYNEGRPPRAPPAASDEFLQQATGGPTPP
ncbi:PBP1A family penicillin-binding protein [Erythrobacter sp. T5W1-R]|uniref:transglycosylase domain-containing protein n=1 Tax=Erythrobacter sp. T5W1-R TaxID=3101752 RepID=UPI002AFEC502|nr:PBP1A family penicillin-binding protein [Erythrobacter sp. T5W1-R]MEA1619038.1 PBP1A family penicillin-binding protein [Erythrobacter sp. T5W1-R]